MTQPHSLTPLERLLWADHEAGVDTRSLDYRTEPLPGPPPVPFRWDPPDWAEPAEGDEP